MMKNATEANNGQALGIEQVSAAVEHMGTITQDTAANAGELVVSGDQLKSQASQLNKVIRVLENIIGGGRELRSEASFQQPGTGGKPAPARFDARRQLPA